MDMKLSQLEQECCKLRKRLSCREELESEVEILKRELETSLESHKKLQEVALEFENENRNIQKKFKEQLEDKVKMDAKNIDLEHQVASKHLSYEQIEKKYMKLKEKLEKYEDLEDKVYNLENEKRKKQGTIQQLEEELNSYYDESELQRKESEERIKKLEKENTDLNNKLITYIDEMEDMDTRVDKLETENQSLKAKILKLREVEMFGTHLDQIEDLELEKMELVNKLEKEKERREDIENELFRTEEELENYLSKDEMNQDKFQPSLETIEEINFEELDDNVRQIVEDKQLTIHNLEKLAEDLRNRVNSLEEEREVLLEENGLLAKSNMDYQRNHIRSNESYENKINELQQRIKELNDEQKNIERDKFNRLVSSAEKEYECSQKHQEERIENERLRNEIKVAQEYLRLSAEKNKELQLELEQNTRDYKKRLEDVKEEMNAELRSLKVILEEAIHYKQKDKERELTVQAEKNLLISQMEANMEHMKQKYENKQMEQNLTIRNLEEQITALRSFYENKSYSSPSSAGTPPLRNGKAFSSMIEIRHSLAGGNENDENIPDDLSDREMRRISYKVAEGTWKRLSSDIPINRQDLCQIVNSNANAQEKVYQILNCWRNESNIPRDELLKELAEYIDPNRKDVFKFLKEMSGNSTGDKSSIKTKFKKFKRSVRR